MTTREITSKLVAKMPMFTKIDNAKKLKIYSNFSLWQLLLLLFIFIVTLFPINIAIGALSAKTANTIKGTKPYFMLGNHLLTSLDELLGFTYSEAGVTTSVDASQADQTFIFSKNTPNSIVTAVPVGSGSKTLASLVQSATSTLKVADADGDSVIASTTSARGTMKANFSYNGNNYAIENLNDCFSDTKIYQLNIEITPENVSGVNIVDALTQYGDPNSSINYYSGINATSKSVTYNFKIFRACAIKTKDMSVGVGFDSSLWVVNEGYSIEALENENIPFPRTGFPNASLQIIGSGKNQNLFECRKNVTGSDWVTMSTDSGAGTNCTITYNNTSGKKPTGDILIDVGINIDGKWFKVDDYTIPEPVLWAEIGNPAKIAPASGFSLSSNNSIRYYDISTTRYLAAESCYTGEGVSTIITSKEEASSKFFTRTQISNLGYQLETVAYARYLKPNAFSSMSSFMGEWGAIDNYPNSPWVNLSSPNNFWWTGDRYGTQAQAQWGVYKQGGWGSQLIDFPIGYVVCKRD